jgi:hypothetical protein
VTAAKWRDGAIEIRLCGPSARDARGSAGMGSVEARSATAIFRSLAPLRPCALAKQIQLAPLKQ